MENSGLKHGIFVIFRANVIYLFFNLITSLLLPKVLTVPAYADIKMFQLYITYVGLLHFGFADGMYLKYGGKTGEMIDRTSIGTDLSTMRLFQLAMVAVCVGIGAAMQDPIFIAFSFAVLPLNMTSYFQLLFQATGEFQNYSRAVNISTTATFAVNMILMYLVQIRGSGLPYIALYVAVDVAVWLFLEIWFEGKFHLRRLRCRPSLKVLRENIRDGILLMLGNLSNLFFTGMDRWFVKFLMNTTAFAQYSFAVSMEGFLNAAVTPVSITLYNYFCRHPDEDSVKRVQGMVMIFAAAIPACAFPAKFILEHFLTKYIDASSVLFYLFAAQTYATITKCVYVNLYKARRLQTRYFIKLVFVLAVGFGLNALFWVFLHDKTAFAIGTLLSNIVWFLLSTFDFRRAFPPLRQFVFLFLETILFMTCGIMLNAVAGLLVYIAGSFLFGGLLMRTEMKNLAGYLKSK